MKRIAYATIALTILTAIIGCQSPQNTTATRLLADACTVSQRGSSVLWLTGDLLLRGRECAPGSIKISDTGLIERIECREITPEELGESTLIRCIEGIISPALINPHDHIKSDGYKPVNFDKTRFDVRNTWRAIIGDTLPDGRPDEVLWSEIRYLLAGTLTFADKEGRGNLLIRNASEPKDFLALPGSVNYQTFPLLPSDPSFSPTEMCGYQNYVELHFPVERRLVAHVSEGITAVAQDEFTCLFDNIKTRAPLMPSHAALIHMIASNVGTAQKIKERDLSVIWSPRSNISLYGNTAPVALFKQFDINIALGADWTVSGSMNMLRELSCADNFDNNYLNDSFSDEDLWWMATGAAAKALNVESQVGELKVGLIADLSIFQKKSTGNKYRSIIEAKPSDILLVLKAGRAIYGNTALVQAIGDNCEDIATPVCGAAKSICLEKNGVSSTYAQLQMAYGAHYYPLYFCDEPVEEPTCTPFRQGEYNGTRTALDSDGDGIDGFQDNCPFIFNPIRPMDKKKQPDLDGDGLGDSCDSSPAGAAQ